MAKFFDRFVAIFGQNYCSFSPTFREIFFCQNPFSAILRLKKSSDGHSALFLQLPLASIKKNILLKPLYESVSVPVLDGLFIVLGSGSGDD